MGRKYPFKLFLTGFLLNLFVKFFFLFLPCAILLVMGIWSKICLYMGALLLVTDILFSLFEQMKIRKTVLKNNDLNFREFQKAVLSHEWENNVKDFAETKISDYKSTEE